MAASAVPFEIASGSVAGRDHRIGVPKNRQDDYCVLQSPDVLVAIVTDGCGSGGLATQNNSAVRSMGSSEVGASIGARLMAHCLMRAVTHDGTVTQRSLLQVQRRVEAQLHVLAAGMGGSFSEVVDRYFLFTLLGAVITESRAVFFGLGDGLIFVNGYPVGTETLSANDQNQPIYLGYSLSGSALTDDNPALLDIQVLCDMPTADVQHFLLATDGAAEFLTRPTDSLPGLDKPLGPINQFWEESRYFANPAAVTRQLNLAARDWQGPSGRVGGLLHDDTTIVSGRRLIETAEAQLKE